MNKIPGFKVQLGKGRTIASKTGVRPWQGRAFTQLVEAFFNIINTPTGSGKSWLVCMISAARMLANPKLRVLIAVPQTIIAKGFRSAEITLPDGTKVPWNVPPEADLCAGGHDKVQKVLDFLVGKSKHRVVLCTHGTLAMAYRKAVQRGLWGKVRDCAFWIDESHHAVASDAGVQEGFTINQLGRLVHACLGAEDRNLQLGLVTASFFRGDKIPILRAADAPRFSRFNLPYDEYLPELKHLKSFSFDFLLYKNNSRQVLEDLFKQRVGKTIAYIPSVRSRYSSGDKHFDAATVLRAMTRAVGASGRLPKGAHTVLELHGRKRLRVVNLVDAKLREEKKAFLNAIQTPGELDAIIALGMFKEGADWVWADRSIVIGARNSLVEIVQILGRILRDVPGKKHVEFVQLIKQPRGKSHKQELELYLGALYASLIMENIMSARPPHTRGKTKCAVDEFAISGPRLVDLLGDEASQVAAVDAAVRVLANLRGTPTAERRDKFLDMMCKPLLQLKVPKDALKSAAEELWSLLARRAKATLKTMPQRIPPVDMDELDPSSAVEHYMALCGADSLRAFRDKMAAFPSYDELRQMVMAAGIKTMRQYYKWRKCNPHLNAPVAPFKTYKGCGWISVADFYRGAFGRGVPFVSYEQLKSMVQVAGVTGKSYSDWVKNTRRSHALRIPTNPQNFYGRSLWTGRLAGSCTAGWVRGSNFPTYAEFVALVRSAGIRSCKQYNKWRKTVTSCSLPSSPEKVYAGCGWTSWLDVFPGVINAPDRRMLRRLSPAEVAGILAQLRKGVLKAVISREFGISTGTLWQLRKRFGLLNKRKACESR